MSSRYGGRARRVGLLSAMVAMVTPLVTALSPTPARADQISDLQAQASSISQQLVQTQLQIDAYQQQATALSAKVAADTHAVDNLAQEIWQDEQAINRYTVELRRQAVTSYMRAGTDFSSPEIALFSGHEDAAQAAEVYTGIALGNIRATMRQVHTSQATLRSDETALDATLARDRADQTERLIDLNRATNAGHQMAVLQGRVTTQLAAAIAAARTPPPSALPSGSDPALNPFLQCVLRAESGGNYGAVSPNGLYMGAFQFSQSTWNEAALAAGRPDLVGVRPNTASKADQDLLAVTLYALDGERPWFDPCRK